MSRTVYIFGGYLPYGGAFAVYTIGQILQKHFGFRCRVVRLPSTDIAEDRELFVYPDKYECVNIATLMGEMSKSDLLVMGASASSYGFGLSLPGKKLMCILGYNTFNVLDGFCDYYMCNSKFVQHFVNAVYGFTPPLIPPFIDLKSIPSGQPWQERPANVILTHGKQFFPELVQELQKRMGARHPSVEFELIFTQGLPHHEFLEQLAHYRYFMPMSPCEGFGLTPLEAMACGCCVVGFHGNGGLEYMRPGINCEVAGYPQLDALTDKVAAVLKYPDKAEALARQGMIDAQNYDYPKIERQWIDYLSEIVR